MHGKPHPEPYLLAAERLGVDPVQCVAIEDSPTGVASASAAGCVVVAVPNIVPIDPAPGRFIVSTLKGIEPGDLGLMVATTPETEASPSEPERRPTRRAVVLAAAALALLAVVVALVLRRDDDPTDVAPPPARPPIPVAVHAWTPYWALEDALPEMEARAPTMAQLSPFWWVATDVESIEVQPNTPADEAEQFLETARELGVPLVASILDGTEPGAMAEILADPDQRSRHVDTIAGFADDGDFDGIDIDYEQFAFADGRDTWSSTRPNWVAFVEELAARLHDDGRILTVSVPPVYDAGQTADSGFWVYDYAAITPHVDAIRVMAYDYSVAAGDPGPIAPLAWVEQVIAGTSAASGDPSKLVLGVPLYGYNWPVATNGECPSTAEGVTSVTNRTVADLAARRGATPQFDPVTYEWSFTYDLAVEDGTTSCTQTRQVHYVDDDGAQVRMQRAIDAGFGGVALFAFGYDDADTWAAIDTVAASVR